MSLNEAISEGLMVTGVGLLIVFGVLIILMLALMAMKAIFYKDPEDEKKKDNVNPSEKAPSEVQNTAVCTDDSELIAVLTAAVAAVLNTSTSKLCIKSYKRVGNNAPLWNRAGVSEMLNTRL